MSWVGGFDWRDKSPTIFGRDEGSPERWNGSRAVSTLQLDPNRKASP